MEPTVTDANLVAGRLPATSELPDLGVLDRAVAEAALDRAGVTAEGVLAVVDAAMVRALRHVSVEQGVDPRGLVLVAFGGAGPLHACGLAEALGITTVIVPPAGVFSAVGVLCSPRQREIVRSWAHPLDHEGLDEALSALGEEAAAGLGGQGPVEVEGAVDCRYAGQSFELRVPSVADFPAAHRTRNGYERADHPVEVVALRSVARRPAPLAVTDLPAPPRVTAQGPLAIAEPDCTIWLPEGWRADQGAAGALLVTREGER